MTDSSWPLIDGVPPLGPDDVHVWMARLDIDLQHLESTLSLGEVARADRFFNPRDRRRYVVGRGYLRQLLGEYLAIPPARIGLTATVLGKPYLADAQSGIRFNLAHSEDLALFAFARGREVGIDIERERPDLNWRELAKQNFAPEEYTAIASEPGTVQQREAFFRCWTRKEAYVKALGLGMQVPLARFAVTITPDPAMLLHTSHEPAQHGRWTLRGLSPAAGFAAALAVEGQNWQLFCAQRSVFP